MSATYGLDAYQLDAWLRNGMTHAQIEAWWAEHPSSVQVSKPVTNTMGVVTVGDNTRKAIGGRHFASGGIPQLTFDEENEVDLLVECEQAIVTDDVAAVRLAVHLNGLHWTVDGSAKRDPSDRPNHEVGMALATARAVQRLATQLARQASGKSKHADWIELDHQARKGAKKSKDV